MKTTTPATNIHDQLVARSLEEGFILASGVDVEAAAEEYQKHFKRFESWLADGNQASMAWLERGLERRSDLKKILPSVQSVFSVAMAYPTQIPGTADEKEGVRYARYMWGGDYHEVMKAKLEKVAQALSIEHGFEYKICVDTSAVLERAWAVFAGLGWIGKNSMLIHPKHGSFFLIGSILLSQKLDQGLKVLPNYCGNCSACLKGCPTDAFTAPGVLDARKCISAWTLETRGELQLSEKEKQAVGNRIAGCDICQEVCPFNQKVLKRDAPVSEVSAMSVYRFADLANETKEQYKARVKNSALSRVKYEDFRRNLHWIQKNSSI